MEIKKKSIQDEKEKKNTISLSKGVTSKTGAA